MQDLRGLCIGIYGHWASLGSVSGTFGAYDLRHRSGPAKDERFQNIDGHSPSLQDDPQCMKKKKGLFFVLFQIIVPFPNKMVVLSSSG